MDEKQKITEDQATAGQSLSQAGLGFSTRAISAGNDYACTNVPIFTAVTSADWYARHRDPTRDALHANIASLEGGKYAYSAAGGMAVISLVMQTFLNSGDRVLCHRSVYDWSYALLKEELPRTGNIKTDFLNLTDLERVRAALVKNRYKMVYFETMANPTLEVPDIAALCEMARAAGAMVVVDNTFVSPYLARPLELGADLVVESATKFICGHGDSLGGVAVTRRKDFYDRLYHVMKTHGGAMSPFNAYLILRGIKTLSLRMEKHCENARKLAAYLKTKKAVTSLNYPGDPEHPDHRTVQKQLKLPGSMLGFTLDADKKRIDEFKKKLKLVKCWVSLGDTHTLMAWQPEHKERGIPTGYNRISVGLEDIEDIINDFEQAFQKVFPE